MPDRTPTLLLAILACCACGDRADPLVTELTVDTLADGSIRVSNPVHGLWDVNPGTRWRLVESLRIGTATDDGPDAFGNVISLTLDALDRLWIVDSQANEVRVFDSNGGYVRIIGGRGEGPGEFIGARGVGHGPNGEIWVEDGRLKRWEIFDTAGSRIGGQRYVTQVGGEWRLGFFLAHDWIQDSDQYVYRVYRPGATGGLEPDGRVFKLPEEPPDPPQIEFTRGGATFSFWAPFSPLSKRILGPNLDIWWSDGLDKGGRYELRRIDLESGRTLHTVLRQYEPVVISEAARVAGVEAELDPVRGGHNRPGAPRPPPEAMDLVPRVYPPFEDFHLSRDGSLWVRRNLGDGVVGVDVFDSEGRYLGQPEIPDGFADMSVRLIIGDRMYVIDSDEMGVDYVVRLEIVRSP